MRAIAELPWDLGHLVERYGILTLIVLGESFVKVLSALASGAATVDVFVDAAGILVITCGVWWVYFDDVAGSRIKKKGPQWLIWIYAHLPLQLGITALAVGLKKATDFEWSQPAKAGYGALVAGSLALVLVSVAVIDSVTERRQAELDDRTRINARWTSALVLVVVAVASPSMSGGLFLAVVTGVVLAQVGFDMLVEPYRLPDYPRAPRRAGQVGRNRADTRGRRREAVG
jgi:low temperature requirement protein LtrA